MIPSWSSSAGPSLSPALAEASGANAPARPLYKALDALMTAPLRPRLAFSGNLRRLLQPRLSQYERLSTLANLLDGLAPGLARRLSAALYRPHLLPFAARGLRLFSYGSGSTVFLLEGGERRLILKVYRRSLGKNGAQLGALARHFRLKYESVAGWYRGPHALVPDTAYLILQGPLLGRPAVAALQAYIPGEKKDFFRDFTDDELLALLEGEAFRARFLFFARRTLEVYRESGRCFDFVGRDNLMVVQGEQGPRLAVIDFGIFEREALRRTSPETLAQVEACLGRLEHLLTRAGRAAPARAGSRE